MRCFEKNNNDTVNTMKKSRDVAGFFANIALLGCGFGAVKDPLGLFVQCPRFVLCDIFAGLCIGLFSALHRAQQIAATKHTSAICAN